MKKFIVLFSLLFTSIAVLATPPVQSIKIMLNSFPTALYAPLFIAEQQGYFQKVGLSVLILSAPNTSRIAQALQEKKADLGIIPEPELLHFLASGYPLSQVGKFIETPLDAVVALKESGIHDVASLKGKRINLIEHSLSRSTLKALLAQAGLSEADVSLVKINKPLSQALVSHEVDAVIGLSRNTDVPVLEKQGHAVVTFFPEEHGVPTYQGLVFISLKEHNTDPRFLSFLTAIKQAIQYLEAHPQLAWQKMIKTYPAFNSPENKETWFATLPYYTEHPAFLEHPHRKRLEQFMQTHALLESNTALKPESKTS